MDANKPIWAIDDDVDRIVGLEMELGGVTESKLPNLVKPFYRVPMDRAKKTGGAGVGLAIADRAVALRKGRVNVENSPEGGFLVRIILPA